MTSNDGAVTLIGSIDTYAGKLAAERSAKRVHGVRTVANDLDVKLATSRIVVEPSEEEVLEIC